nr:YCF48-related protein [Ignavibacteriaceae bacterium]
RDGVVLKTEDGGKNWTTIQTQTMAMLYSIKFISQNNGWAVGDSGVVLKTTDGGVNWLLKSKNLNSHLTNGFFLNSQTGW